MNDIVIERMGEKGDGLAQGKAYPRSLPGEVLRQGVVVSAAPDRVQPICPVFARCGGCKLQHWQSKPYQLWKTALLANALAARGIETKIAPLVEAHGAGRRRVALHLRLIENRWAAGFMAEGSHALVPIDHCPILVPNLQAAPAIAVKFGPFFGACDVWMTEAANGLDVAIKAERKLADLALAQFDGLMKANGIIRIAVNGETRAQLAIPVVKMGPASVPLAVGGFLQATAEGEEVLANIVTAAAKKAKRVIDLFSGSGPFSFRLAQMAAVHALDNDKPALAALQSALRNTQGLKPITTEQRDLFRNPVTWQELNEFDLAVLDPPRAGAEAQCAALAKSKIKRVIYVSCDPQSLARDAATLVQAGFHLQQATPVDQFKFSPHVETVAQFKRP